MKTWFLAPSETKQATALLAYNYQTVGSIPVVEKAEYDKLVTNSIHTCHDECERVACVLHRKLQAAEAEVERTEAQNQRLRVDSHLNRALAAEDKVRELEATLANHKLYEDYEYKIAQLQSEVDQWKAKYIDARKSGYAEGLEVACAQGREIEKLKAERDKLAEDVEKAKTIATEFLSHIKQIDPGYLERLDAIVTKAEKEH